MRFLAAVCAIAAMSCVIGGAAIAADGQSFGFGWIVAGLFAFLAACAQWTIADQASGLNVIREAVAAAEQTDGPDLNITPCHTGCLEHAVEDYFGAINRVRQPAVDLLTLNKEAGFSDEASEHMAIHHFYECIDHVRGLQCRNPFQPDDKGGHALGGPHV